jgi:CO/xanthine dehydrogenase FAD-binding subunit
VYFRPGKLKDACEVLAERRLTVLAGGTDHYPSRVGRSPREDILDLTGVAELRGIRKSAQGWRIGATTTWTDLLEAKLPPLFDALRLAAREVGGAQIQNAGTIAGNVCNASPAADGVPALLALDASVELASARGTRTLALAEFILGPRKTALARDEIMAALLIPAPRAVAHSHFLKLGARKYLVISIAMAAAVVETERNIIQAARIAVGACSPVAARLPALEAALAGVKLDALLGERARPEHLAALQPIDDVRADAAYRREAALTLVRRTLNELGSRA